MKSCGYFMRRGNNTLWDTSPSVDRGIFVLCGDQAVGGAFQTCIFLFIFILPYSRVSDVFCTRRAYGVSWSYDFFIRIPQSIAMALEHGIQLPGCYQLRDRNLMGSCRRRRYNLVRGTHVSSGTQFC